MLEKNFDFAEAEKRIYDDWEASGAFKPAGEGEPFTIVIPPPNVTGSLHMGHALNNTLQDVLCRFERMRGRRVLWQPGTDHAGIATQMVVERQMMERQEPKRTDIGRDAFVEKVWKWRHESGGQIINQLKRLGATCDWSRERFTMGDDGAADDQMVKAVMKVFVDLYNDGLIYRDKRLVNWDPKFETAISDLEVENTEVDGHMWHFKYPLAGGATYEYVEKDEDGNERSRETRDYISIATTRPETMLGDGAVAVHPSDERYASIVGKLCEIPVGPKAHRRLIPIIVDDYPDPDFGSGAVKITGAHDFNDYQVAKRGDIPMYRLMDWDASMRKDGAPYAEEAAKAKELLEADGTPDANFVDGINLVPDEYRGLDRFEARKRVVADIDAEGLMITVEDKKIMQPFGDRSGVVIEPMITDQWYVDAKTLAKPAIEAVEQDRTRFVPENWAKTYFQWMHNIEPWCISRQLWWGHRIPAWYGPDGKYFIGENYELALEQAHDYYSELNDDCVLGDVLGEDISKYEKINVFCLDEANDPSVREASGDASVGSAQSALYVPEDGGYAEADIRLVQDPDVLDTWFSSGLWPFSTLGWPEETSELKTHYPNSVLVTAHDIIFFWVARMMMQGIHFMGDVPFNDVYIHALVLDEKGQKMSKSKGNVIDPLVLIDKFGADALRFTLAAQAAQGRNIRLSEQRVEGYRNFATKLWNAARFAQMNDVKPDASFDPAAATLTLNQWIVHEANECASAVTRELEAYRFNDAAGAIYRFTWNVFCDWFLELAKPVFQGDDEAAKKETRVAGAFALGQILKLLHPFMPFVSEELWNKLGFDGALITTPWPQASAKLENASAADEMRWVTDVVKETRSMRAEAGVPPGAKVALTKLSGEPQHDAWLSKHGGLIERLARLSGIATASRGAQKNEVVFIGGTVQFAMSLEGAIDVAAERERVNNDVARVEKEIATIDKKLANKNFVERAPAEVVEEQKSRRAGYEDELEKLNAALARLKDL